MEMHLVLGGPFSAADPFQLTTDQIELVGLFPNYDDALEAWRGASQRTIDDAEMRFVVVPLHDIVAQSIGLRPKTDFGSQAAASASSPDRS